MRQSQVREYLVCICVDLFISYDKETFLFGSRFNNITLQAQPGGKQDNYMCNC